MQPKDKRRGPKLDPEKRALVQQWAEWMRRRRKQAQRALHEVIRAT